MNILAENLSPFVDGGPVDHHMLTVYTAIFWGSVVLGSFTAILLLVAFFRFRRKHDDEEPEQVHGNTRLEVIWTVVPFVILFSLFILTASNMPFINNQSTAANALRIKVEGQQYQWIYHYPNGGQTATKLFVPTGTPINLDITSDDVNHSFFVPSLAGQINAIPGQTNTMWLQVDQPGTYYGQCTELCGYGHHQMQIQIIALPYSQYNACVNQQGGINDHSQSCKPPEGS